MANTTAKNEIQIFCYKSMPVRTVELDGDTWFVAKDICDILEITKYRDAISKLDADERGLAKVDTPGGMQDMTVINEAGLYTLLMRSNKPEAKPFRRWVTHDVLPSIRKTGHYTAPNTREKPEKKIHMPSGWANAVSKIIDWAFKAKTDEDFQKVLALDLAFYNKNGYSALNSAGLHIDTVGKGSNAFHEWNLHSIDWEFHYKLRLDEILTLPEPRTEEYYDEE